MEENCAGGGGVSSTIHRFQNFQNVQKVIYISFIKVCNTEGH